MKFVLKRRHRGQQVVDDGDYQEPSLAVLMGERVDDEAKER